MSLFKMKYIILCKQNAINCVLILGLPSKTTLKKTYILMYMNRQQRSLPVLAQIRCGILVIHIETGRSGMIIITVFGE